VKFESLLSARKPRAKKPSKPSSLPPSLPGAAIARLRSNGAGRHFPASLFAAFELTLRAGQCLVLLGPSGVGKSSLLKLLSGALTSEPCLSLEWLGARPKRLAYMAQSDVLLPWRNLLGNVSLGSLMRGQRQDRARAASCLEQVGLEARWHRAYPHQLSGGMRQRVALARCLYEQAELVLMDEPLSAVDAGLRIELQGLLAERLAHKTRVLVTHDPFEAARLGQVIVVLGGAPAGVCLQINDERKGPRAFDDALVRANAERLTRCLLEQPWQRLSGQTRLAAEGLA
jgi:putative hydroxymethylpyrimidine transport system ATP-binding protein